MTSRTPRGGLSSAWSVPLLVLACGPGVDPAPRGVALRESGQDLFRLGMDRAAHGDSVRAEQYFVAAVARGFPADRAMPVLVRVCLAGDRLRAALEHAVPYLSRHPRDFPLRDLVATIRFALGDASGAARELEDSLAVAPERASSRYLLAVVLRDGLRDPAGAARAFAAYLAAEPDGTHAAEARSWLAEHGRATPGETGRGRVPMGAPRREN